jgi:Putative Ig domain
MNAILAINDAPYPGGAGTLAAGMVGDAYTTTLTASDGSGQYQWSLISPPAMPPGLRLDGPTGVISGVPTQLAEGTTSITVQVSDGEIAVKRSFSLTINPGLRITGDTDLYGSDAVRLKATGGSAPYAWSIVGDLPAWLRPESNTGIITILKDQVTTETKQFNAKVTDSAQPPHTDESTFNVIARKASRWRHPLRPVKVCILNVKFRPRRRLPSLGRFGHLTSWLGILALGIPVLAGAWIVIYAFTTPGSHGTYLGVAMLTATAAFLIGCLIGFLFGVPRVVSSGQARLGQSSEYTPSSNLSEVSDWLTKLLLGAGLVQLTHLGAPIGSLINHIAAALHTTSSYAEAAKVTAGTIVFGYVAIGLLDGYVVTTMWYQRRLAQLNAETS